MSESLGTISIIIASFLFLFSILAGVFFSERKQKEMKPNLVIGEKIPLMYNLQPIFKLLLSQIIFSIIIDIYLFLISSWIIRESFSSKK